MPTPQSRGVGTGAGTGAGTPKWSKVLDWKPRFGDVRKWCDARSGRKPQLFRSPVTTEEAHEKALAQLLVTWRAGGRRQLEAVDSVMKDVAWWRGWADAHVWNRNEYERKPERLAKRKRRLSGCSVPV